MSTETTPQPLTKRSKSSLWLNLLDLGILIALAVGVAIVTMIYITDENKIVADSPFSKLQEAIK